MEVSSRVSTDGHYSHLSEPVLDPLPGVANHVVETVVVLRGDRRAAVHGTEELVAVLRQVAAGECALEHVGAGRGEERVEECRMVVYSTVWGNVLVQWWVVR